MQVEKDIVAARKLINGKTTDEECYRPVKLFTDRTLKPIKGKKINNKNVLCKMNSSDEVIDLLSYNSLVTCYSDNRLDEYFLKLKLEALKLKREEFLGFFMKDYGRYSATFNYETYKIIRKTLDDKTRYFFDELYKDCNGKSIRKSNLFKKDRFNYNELNTLVRYFLNNRYYEARDGFNNNEVNFIYSKDEDITKLDKLFKYIYLMYDMDKIPKSEITKKENIILSEFSKMLIEYGSVDAFYTEKGKSSSFLKEDYRVNPSVNGNIAYVYTYKKNN